VIEGGEVSQLMLAGRAARHHVTAGKRLIHDEASWGDVRLCEAEVLTDH
jgi:hypothetical protein